MPSFDIEALLNSDSGPAFRAEMGHWIEHLIPGESLVPEVYRHWRLLVRDAISFIFSRLSPTRLAAKISEQMQLPPDASTEVRLMRLIRKMPGLQKLGQVLARNRHLDPALRRELLTLENGIRDVEFDEIRAVIERELGAKLQALAVEIEPRIFSEASVSAVVRFTWRGGNAIFKVMKPHIPDCFAEDMELLQELAGFVASGARDYGFVADNAVETFSDIRRLLEHEVKFEYEQQNLREAAQVFGSIQGVRVPQIIPELCTPAITAMSEERGVKATELSERTGAVRREIARRVIEALFIGPLFSEREEALFHADPHAGNMLYDARRRELVFLDWALTGRLSRSDRRHVCMLLAMMGLRDVDGVCESIVKLGEISRPIQEEVAGFLLRIPVTRIPGSMDAVNLLDYLALRGVRFPAELLMFRKVLFTLDGVVRDIAREEISLDEVIAGYLTTRWFSGFGASPLPITPAEWLALMASASSYPLRLWWQALF